MRTALEQIKADLGAEAVIMSNKKIPEGVELMAAVDYGQQSSVATAKKTTTSSNGEAQKNSRAIENDIVSIGQQPMTQTASRTESTAVNAPVDSLTALLQRKVQLEQANKNNAIPSVSTNINHQGAEQNIEQQFKSFTDRLEQGSLTSEEIHNGVSSQSQNNGNASSMHAQPAAVANTSQSSQPQLSPTAEMEKMRQEMLSIRQLLEHQISGLMWQDMAQKDPTKALMVNRLMNLGLNEQVSDQIASYIPPHQSEQQAWDEAKQLLAQQLNTTNNEIIHRGGVVSLIGPTGVGKTTTVAKLAARFAQIHGADQVAMISTDSYRIAGFEQLSTYGRIIGCQVKLAKDGAALETLLQQFSQKKLILIDTAGMGQRDLRLAERLTTLITSSRVRIRNYLVLAANTQQRVMQENVERFKKVPLAGCIYTKLDESLSVGEIIATSIQNGLPIGYLTDGQRVPEDIKVANAGKLVTLADRLATKINHQDSRRPMPTAC